MDDFSIKGAAELDRALQNFPANVERNILRGGVRAGGVVYQHEAQALTPVRSGKLRSSIRVSMRVKAGQILARIIAGGRKKGDAFYAHMVEGGTKPHEIRPKGWKSLFFAGIFAKVIEHPGARAHAFMKPAFDNKTQAVLDRIAEYVRARIDKEAKRK